MLDSERLLDVKAVAGLLGICQRSVWNHCKAGTLPAPIRLGGRRLWSPGPLKDAVARLHEAAQRADSKGDRP
jgi:hypothetical protein